MPTRLTVGLIIVGAMLITIGSPAIGYVVGYEQYVRTEDQEEVREETPAPEPVEEAYEENEGEIEEEKSVLNPGQSISNPVPFQQQPSAPRSP